MLIRNANLLNPGTERGIYDILIRDGKIAQIAPHIDAEEEVELDVQEMYVTPGSDEQPLGRAAGHEVIHLKW